MNDENTTKVTCGQCGSQLPEQDVRQTTSPPCPNCGTVKGSLALSLSDTMPPIHESLTGKVEDPARSSKDNPRVHFFTGDEIRSADGKWMKKDRTIDRDRNQYKETVTDPEAGEVIHHCDEPLKAHTGHGSAKPKETGAQATEGDGMKRAAAERHPVGH